MIWHEYGYNLLLSLEDDFVKSCVFSFEFYMPVSQRCNTSQEITSHHITWDHVNITSTRQQDEKKITNIGQSLPLAFFANVQTFYIKHEKWHQTSQVHIHEYKCNSGNSSRMTSDITTWVMATAVQTHQKTWSNIDCLPSKLTLNVRGPSYLGLTRLISWLLMPWLLMSPGHQQPWYWLYIICRSFSYLREDFKYLSY